MPRPIIFGCTKDDKIYQEQVLPRLLDHTKITTIRPMWKEVKAVKEGYHEKGKPLQYEKRIVMKKQLYHIGDVCKMLWKPRSKFRWFDRKTGIGDNWGVECANCGEEFHFPKQLGKVKIKAIIPITIRCSDGGFSVIDREGLACYTKKMAQEDGFNSGSMMMLWLSQHYDLTTPKPFEIRRWDWI